VVFGFVLSLAAIAGLRAVQFTHTSARPQQPPRTLDLPQSQDVILATSTIEYNVERLGQDWDTLPPLQRDALCGAGNAIRSVMQAHGKTLADLSHVQRAIYDITVPSGRCR
jgi:hypothetical protein